MIATIYKVAGMVVGLLVGLAALGICLNLIFGVGGFALFEPERPWWRGPGILPWWGRPNLLMLPGVGGLILAALAIVGGGLNALALYGFGELIHLLLALEENTRATAEALQRRG